MEIRLFLATLFISVSCITMKAQDRIYFNDSAPVDAVVKEIGDDYILYRTWDNQDGPDFRTSISRVDRIVFRNGTEKIFGDGGIQEMMTAPGILLTPGRLEYRRGRFYRGLSVVTPDQIRDYLGYKNYGSVYLKAKRQYTAGAYLTYTGAGLLFIGVIAIIADATGPSISGDFGDDASMTGIGTACSIIGAAGLASGIPLMVIGNRKLDAIADDYNSRHGYSMKAPDRAMSLTLGTCRSGGVGLAFNF